MFCVQQTDDRKIAYLVTRGDEERRTRTDEGQMANEKQDSIHECMTKLHVYRKELAIY